MNKILKIGLFSLLIISFACESKKGEQRTSLFDGVETVIEQKYDSGKFNGTVLISLEDSVYLKSYGLANKRSDVPLKETDIFYIGSLAKQFTAGAILILNDKAALSLDDKVTQYISELPTFCDQITIRNLLNHTSGLPDYYAKGAFKSGMKNSDVLDFAISIDSLDFTPSQKFSYSNTAYVLLSVIVERVSKISFREFLDEKIFRPTGMNYSMVYDETKPRLLSRALGHKSDGALDDYNAYTTGGGGIYSNTIDLLKWVKALNSYQIISKESLREGYSPAKLNDGTLSYYGFGWFLSKDTPEIVKHSGSLAGYRAYLYNDLKKNLVVIVLSNFTNDVGRLTNQVVDKIDG